MKSKFINFVLAIAVLSTLAIFSCQQEKTVPNALSIPTPTNERIANNLQRFKQPENNGAFFYKILIDNQLAKSGKLIKLE